MRKQPTKIECKVCHKLFHRMGINPHMRKHNNHTDPISEIITELDQRISNFRERIQRMDSQRATLLEIQKERTA